MSYFNILTAARQRLFVENTCGSVIFCSASVITNRNIIARSGDLQRVKLFITVTQLAHVRNKTVTGLV